MLAADLLKFQPIAILVVTSMRGYHSDPVTHFGRVKSHQDRLSTKRPRAERWAKGAGGKSFWKLLKRWCRVRPPGQLCQDGWTEEGQAPGLRPQLCPNLLLHLGWPPSLLCVLPTVILGP